MKVKKEDLYKHLGQVFIIKDDIKSGTYILVEISNDIGYGFYNISTKEKEYTYLENTDELTKIPTPELEILDLLIEESTNTLISLAVEGWRLEKNNLFDLEPMMNKLRIFVQIKKLLNE